MSFQVAYHHAGAHLYFVNHNERQRASQDPWNLHMSLIDHRSQCCQAGHLGQLKHIHTWLACPSLSHTVGQVLSVILSEIKCLHLIACRSRPESTHFPYQREHFVLLIFHHSLHANKAVPHTLATKMFIKSLFIRAKSYKPSECPTIGHKDIKVHLYHGIVYSSEKCFSIRGSMHMTGCSLQNTF